MAIRHEYPAGKPRVIIGRALSDYEVTGQGVKLKTDSPEAPSLEGLIQCTVAPPDALFYPVLPTFCRGKLMYGLCDRCLLEGKVRFCPHSDEERQMTGTWTVIELAAALRCGYRLVAVHEILAYDRTEPLFLDFYLPLARQKLQSEGFPRDDMTWEEKVAYVDDINAHMPAGFDLRPERVSRNSGRRNFAKLVSNAALGKLSQNDQKPKSRFARSWTEVNRLREHHRYQLKRLEPLSNDLCELIYEPREERMGVHKNTQVNVYSYVTARGRLYMLEAVRWLLSIGCRLFYQAGSSSARSERRLRNAFLLPRRRTPTP